MQTMACVCRCNPQANNVAGQADVVNWVPGWLPLAVVLGHREVRR